MVRLPVVPPWKRRTLERQLPTLPQRLSLRFYLSSEKASWIIADLTTTPTACQKGTATKRHKNHKMFCVFCASLWLSSLHRSEHILQRHLHGSAIRSRQDFAEVGICLGSELYGLLLPNPEHSRQAHEEGNKPACNSFTPTVLDAERYRVS